MLFDWFNLDKYDLFKNIDRNNYKHNCLYLALRAGGLSDIKLQHLMLTLRNRTIQSQPSLSQPGKVLIWTLCPAA